MATLRQQIENLEKVNIKLRTDNLRMRLEFEVIIENQNGAAAQKILSKYMQKSKVLREKDLATKN
jgi:hypothetical protein